MRRRKPFLLASRVACCHCGSPFNSLMCHGHARHDGTPFNLLFHVGCESCRATGPIAKTAREAIAAWEHRTPLRQVTPPSRQLFDIEFEEFGTEEGASATG